jgi:SIR2-like domain
MHILPALLKYHQINFNFKIFSLKNERTMAIDITTLVRRLNPEKTILFLGAGSSIPSGCPSACELVYNLAKKFHIDVTIQLSLSDLATVIESKYQPRDLIEQLQRILLPIRPTRGILNLPMYGWAGLYTTNYDKIIEQSYELLGKNLHVISSNFDFYNTMSQNTLCLHKIHGTIEKDQSLGDQCGLVISATDYDKSHEYREILYAKFAEQLLTKDAIFIGYSLADPDLRATINHAIRLKRDRGAPGRITLFAYEPDENQTLIYESRGLNVCIGGIDEFFAEMADKTEPHHLLPEIITNPLDRARKVYPSTISVLSARDSQTPNLSRMFNGSPANYADILHGWTFERDLSLRLETQLADVEGKRVACVLGAAGSGKTTCVRTVLSRLVDREIECWEHVKEFSLPAEDWALIDDELRKRKQLGVLLIDDAHQNLHEINTLIDLLCKNDISALKVVLISSKPNWNPRLKTPSIFTNGEIYETGMLSENEINSLLDLLEAKEEIAALVERSFSGFNRAERRRRLAERCRKDMFVCMKNIFASELFDDIILREYAELIPDYQQVYKRIAGMESAGVRVHRQLVIRAIGIPADQVARYLSDMDGIIEERSIDEREGIFVWRVRHGVIADIISKYSISTQDEFFSLMNNTIEHLSPAYPIEVASMNEICSEQKGLMRIYDKCKQNFLLRKIISLVPYQRVPRHRLITNLISLGEFEQANTEIRLFENEIRIDGPVQRYKVRLLIERARQSDGIMNEHRSSIVREAASIAEAGIRRFPDDKNMYKVYLDAGVAYFRYDRDRSIFDLAMENTKAAYDRILDPELARTIRHYEHIEQRFTA